MDTNPKGPALQSFGLAEQGREGVLSLSMAYPEEGQTRLESVFGASRMSIPSGVLTDPISPPSERSPGVIVPPSCVVYTPRSLADAMVKAIGDEPGAEWLDPCAGKGVFLEALSVLGVPRNRIRSLDAASDPEPQDQLGRSIRPQEFLSWSLETNERFSRIVANPPYVALSRLTKTVQEAATRIPLPDGSRVPLHANCWFAFLAACIRLLRPNGRLCFVLPAAWEYATYGTRIRNSIGYLFGHVEVHRSRRPLFGSVKEGSVVLLAKNHLNTPKNYGEARVLRYEHSDLAELVQHLRRPAVLYHSNVSGTLPATTGRSNMSVVETVCVRSGAPALAQPEFLVKDILEIRLGGVTGDARFFVLSEADRRDNDLPTAALRRIIARAHHLVSGSIAQADWEKLKEAGERVWLFQPSLAQLTNQAVKKYMALSHKEGGCNREAFKIKHRTPWYRTPLPPIIHGFMSGMSSWGPWVVFRVVPRLAATNTLYTVRFKVGKSFDERAAWAMWLLTSLVQPHLARIGRCYADGLIKYEPGDIGRLPISKPLRTKGAFHEYQTAVSALLAGHTARSNEIADAWFR